MLRQPSRHLRRLLCISSLLSTAVVAQTDPDCQCRDPNGVMRDLGTVECVDVTGRQYLVRCEMSTNTPYWRRTNNNDGCPIT
ncbi:MAG: hypothetical protein V3U76_19965 [Granulosicoccus sp.]